MTIADLIKSIDRLNKKVNRLENRRINTSPAEESGEDVAWNDISGKPSTFSPSAHNHDSAYAPVLEADENYVTDTEKEKLSELSGTNSGDQDLSGYSLTSHNHTGVYSLVSHDHAGVYAVVAHNHDATYSLLAHNHTGVYEPANANIQAHISSAHQAVLVSGTNIKTINGVTILGVGDLVVSSALPDMIVSKISPADNQTIAAGYSGFISDRYEIVNTKSLEIGAGAFFQII